MRDLEMELPWFIKRLENHSLPSFVRYGDGEFMCMWEHVYGQKARATNCDGHDYTLPLALDLLHVLRAHNGKMLYGKQRTAFLAKLIGQSPAYTSDLVDVMAPEISWFHGDIFHHASIQGELAPFLRVFLAQRPVLVGPQIFEDLDKRISSKVGWLIPIPSKNCYTAKNQIKEAIYKRYRAGHRLFSVSASMAAKPIIHELAPVMPDACLLDLGSLWDVFCGKPSRTYHKKMTKETYERNLTL